VSTDEVAAGLARALRDLGPRPDRLLVPDGRKMVPLQIADIEWIKAEGDNVRVHRSALVQTSHIREVRGEGSSRYKVLLSDGTTVIVSRSRAPGLKKWMI